MGNVKSDIPAHFPLRPQLLFYHVPSALAAAWESAYDLGTWKFVALLTIYCAPKCVLVFFSGVFFLAPPLSGGDWI